METAPEGLDAVLDACRVFIARLLGESLLHPPEQRRLRQLGGVHDRRGAEEGAQEGNVVHGEFKARAGRDLAGEFQRVETENADAAFDDGLPRGPRQ